MLVGDEERMTIYLPMIATSIIFGVVLFEGLGYLFLGRKGMKEIHTSLKLVQNKIKRNNGG